MRSIFFSSEGLRSLRRRFTVVADEMEKAAIRCQAHAADCETVIRRDSEMSVLCDELDVSARQAKVLCDRLQKMMAAILEVCACYETAEDEVRRMTHQLSMGDGGVFQAYAHYRFERSPLRQRDVLPNLRIDAEPKPVANMSDYIMPDWMR